MRRLTAIALGLSLLGGCGDLEGPVPLRRLLDDAAGWSFEPPRPEKMPLREPHAIGPVWRSCLELPSGTEASYRLVLPQPPCRLDLEVGVPRNRPELEQGPLLTVRVRAAADTETVLHHARLEPPYGLVAGFAELRLDLAAWAGQTVTLLLRGETPKGGPLHLAEPRLERRIPFDSRQMPVVVVRAPPFTREDVASVEADTSEQLAPLRELLAESVVFEGARLRAAAASGVPGRTVSFAKELRDLDRQTYAFSPRPPFASGVVESSSFDVWTVVDPWDLPEPPRWNVARPNFRHEYHSRRRLGEVALHEELERERAQSILVLIETAVPVFESESSGLARMIAKLEACGTWESTLLVVTAAGGGESSLLLRLPSTGRMPVHWRRPDFAPRRVSREITVAEVMTFLVWAAAAADGRDVGDPPLLGDLD